MKGKNKWLFIAALLATTVAAPLTRLGECLQPPPVGAVPPPGELTECVAPTVLDAITAFTVKVIGLY